jgi:SulP family sulfate permease
LDQLGDQKHLRLSEYLLEITPEEENLTRLIEHMERREVQAREYIIRQGEAADEIIMVESGQVTAQIDVEGKENLRLETMTGGRLVGEVGFFLNAPRTASVIVDQPGVVYSLKRQTLEKIKASDPLAFQAFQNMINVILSERIAHLTQALQDVQPGD